MKKALALVLALVLALSMAVSAFGLVALEKVPVAGNKIPVIKIGDLPVEYLYADEAGEYYIALEDKPYENVKVSANGIASAELVEYNPEKMVVEGMNIFYNITKEGEVVYTGLTYEQAKNDAAYYNNRDKVTYWGYELETNVNIIKVVIAENYSVAHKLGTVKVDATLKENGKDVAYAAELVVISDVTVFEYEMVKWAAEHKGALECAFESKGYSEFHYAGGYDVDGDGKYEVSELRQNDDAAVVSTTAFRAIAGKNLVVKCDEMTVTLKAVAAGQKGVNFKHEGVHTVDKDLDGTVDAIAFEFYGDQVITGEYVINVATGYNWFTLREVFGEAVEEDDIISYYVLKNGKVVKEIVVDYMTADIYENVVLELTGSNSTLGSYEIVMEVPAVEGETNPNTGAESVVGVVAALAVVSVATAAAVSLKK